MKNRIFSACLCATLFLSFSLSSIAQTEADMKAWQAYMTPGEMHKMLAAFDGEWNVEGKMWMDPKAQPVTTKGTCTYKMVLGGRYQQSQFKSTFMDQPMEGIGHTAYDNLKKEFESTWIDNMGSGIMKSSGTYDPATKTLNFKGVMSDPMTGKDCSFRETLEIVDDNTHVLTMYNKPAGATEEFKTMEMKFTKKK